MKLKPTKKPYSPSECFKGKNISYRDSNIDNLLQKIMPAVDGGETVSFTTKSSQTFRDMLREFTGYEDVKDEHIFSLKQIEMMLESPQDYGIGTDGYANFFPISKEYMLCASRHDDGQWSARVDELDNSDAWFAGSRLLLRNPTLSPSDPSTLESRVKSLEEDMEKIKRLFK